MLITNCTQVQVVSKKAFKATEQYKVKLDEKSGLDIPKKTK